MTENKAGIHFAWFTGGMKKGCFYTRTVDNGKTFTNHDSVGSLGSHPQLTSLSNEDIIIVWDEATSNNNKRGKRIGVQHRTRDGKTVSKTYITPQNAYASYPVIATTNNNSSIIAYTTKIYDKNYVSYQVASIK